MDMFEVIGSFGPWQRRVFIIFFIINIVGMWQNLAITFFAPNMDFRCVEPSYEEDPGANETAFDNRCEVPANGSNASVPCSKWEYDTSFYSQTIVSEVMGPRVWKEWLISLTKSVYMLGFLISVFVFGQLSDSIGRLPAIVISYIITVVSMLLTLLSNSFVMFSVLRFLQALGRTALTTVGHGNDWPQHRTEVGIGIQLGWSIGFTTLAAVAWFFRHWFWFQLALSVPILPILFFYKMVPESPRWLLTKGRTQQLEKLLTKAAELNGKEIKGDLKEVITIGKKVEEKKKSTETILYVFRWPRMRNRALNVNYLWVVNSFMYYVLFWGIKKWGRRPTLIALMMVGGTACAAIAFVPLKLSWLSTSFAMVGKFCVTGSFGLMYLYTGELFPTVVRNVTLGSCSMCARIGSVLAPFVRELGKATHPAVPNILYGLLALSSGLLAFLLPETREQKLPDTLEEGENFGKIIESKNSQSTEKEAVAEDPPLFQRVHM
ncbi:organic cation transporter protein [Caerostris darwini]|uniref:Organic cation transporter protein n=1 Tax=Caerostris darwini TaxID=1538125 RepID=A0AAV4Q0H3_9ARAC|nr:organic cation transporter protein [Caerostris darwini]